MRRDDWLLGQLPMGMLEDDFFARFVGIFQHVSTTYLDGVDNLENVVDVTVAPEDVVRGFEIEKGRYVELTDEDIDRLDIELTHSIDICDFVDLDEIDPIYFRKAYYLVPEDGAEKPYRLLAEALDQTGKVAIAKVVIRKKRYLAALRPYEGTILLETMYFADEVRKPESVDTKGQLRKAEVDMAKSLVQNLSAKFDPSKYDDTYRKELLELLRAKEATGVVPEPKETGEEAEVVDLMQALRESVERTKSQRAATRKRRAAPKRKKKTTKAA